MYVHMHVLGCACALASQQVVLFGKAVETLGGAISLEKMGHWNGVPQGFVD